MDTDRANSHFNIATGTTVGFRRGLVAGKFASYLAAYPNFEVVIRPFVRLIEATTDSFIPTIHKSLYLDNTMLYEHRIVFGFRSTQNAEFLLNFEVDFNDTDFEFSKEYCRIHLLDRREVTFIGIGERR